MEQESSKKRCKTFIQSRTNIFKKNLLLVFFTVFFLMFNLSYIFSQDEKQVTGTVIDNRGTSLPGVTIVIKGSTQGTVTDSKGNYQLNNVPTEVILVFSFVGMQTREVVVENQTKINISMEEEAIGLEEVVAIGYGVQRKLSITNSASSIDAEDLALGF